MRQDEELERLLGEIPSSAQEKASASSSADDSISDDEQRFGDFYPIPIRLENHLDGGVPGGGGGGGEPHIDPDDIDLWQLNLGGGGGKKIAEEAENVVRSSAPFGHPPRVWWSNQARIPGERWVMNSGPPAPPRPPVQSNAYDEAMIYRALQYLPQQPGFYSYEESLRLSNHHSFLQQQQQQEQQQRQMMEEQARMFAAAMAEQQQRSLRKPPVNFYHNGDATRGRYNVDQPGLTDHSVQLLRSGYQYQSKVRPGGTPSLYNAGNVNPRPRILSHHPKVPAEIGGIPEPKYTSVEEIKGQMYEIAQDQHGCRFLQWKFAEGTVEEAEVIFEELIEHIVDLMSHGFGNYLVQKILTACSEEQRRRIVLMALPELITVSLDSHGTRAVQTLIQTVQSVELVTTVVATLRPAVVKLIQDSNGNHVIQKCLDLAKEHKQYIYDAGVSHCVELATHKHGCCVLQRCVEYGTGSQRDRLVAEIAANALALSQDAFGNYVVQHVLDHMGWCCSWVVREVISRLSGEFAQLAMQKFSSNVVEKCLKLADEENRRSIVQELMSSPSFDQLLHHQYANYVIQSALTSSKGLLHSSLEEAIRPHIPALRSSPYGKRILSRTTASRIK